MTVLGGSVGMAGSAVLMSGLSGCEATEWISDSAIRCKVEQSSAMSRRIRLSVGNLAGSLSASFSFASSAVSVLQRRNTASTGSASITVGGSGLGTRAWSLRVRLGDSVCEATEWVSDSAVRSMSAYSGRPDSRRIAVTIGVESGSLSSGASYSGSELSVGRGANAGATGSSSLTLLGTGLGLRAYSAVAGSGRSSCAASEWVSDTALRGLESHGGVGSQRSAVTAGMRAGSLSGALSFAVAVGSSMRVSNVAASGSASVTVHGAGLGHFESSASARGMDTACELSTWLSETAMACRAAESTRLSSGRTVLTAGRRSGTLTSGLSVAVQAISVTTKANAAGTGSARITMHGAGYGSLGMRWDDLGGGHVRGVQGEQRGAHECARFGKRWGACGDGDGSNVRGRPSGELGKKIQLCCDGYCERDGDGKRCGPCPAFTCPVGWRHRV